VDEAGLNECLQTRFAYATKGDGIYRIDLQTGFEGDVAGYPSPDDLWAKTFGNRVPTLFRQLWCFVVHCKVLGATDAVFRALFFNYLK
jgi:hypothetical protein